MSKFGLGQLVAIGSIKNWEIDACTDLVTVANKPSPTQRKHLIKIKPVK